MFECLKDYPSDISYIHIAIHYCLFTNAFLFFLYLGIPYCGNFARFCAIFYTIIVMVLITMSSAFTFYGFFETNLFDMMLTPFNGQESYHNIIRGKYGYVKSLLENQIIA